MLKVSAFSSCFSPGLLPAQADSSLFAGSTIQKSLPRVPETHRHVPQTHPAAVGRYRCSSTPPCLTTAASTTFHCTPEALSSSWQLHFLQHAYKWNKGSDQQGRELGNHPLRRYKARGQLGSSGAGLSQTRVLIDPILQVTGPFYTAFCLSVIAPSGSFLLCTEPQHEAQTHQAIPTPKPLRSVTCEATVCLETISHLDWPGLFLTIVFVNAGWLGFISMSVFLLFLSLTSTQK